MNDEMWEAVAAFYALCEQSGRTPKMWREIRQVHLGKNKPRESDGAMLTSNLRPISISSVFWRVCSRARFQQPQTQAWLQRALPRYFYGGLPGRGTQDSLGPLLLCTQKKWHVGTLDLEKAFDHGDPVLATKIMCHCGLDPNIARLLEHTWSHQSRCLQLLGQTSPLPAEVANSLPQGDSWSMAAMTFLLLPAALDIQGREPGIQQVIFADDRTFACSSAEQTARVTERWRKWMVRIGLKENTTKAQYFHPQVKGRRALVEAGLPGTCVSPSVRILGYSFQAPGSESR